MIRSGRQIISNVLHPSINTNQIQESVQLIKSLFTISAAHLQNTVRAFSISYSKSHNHAETEDRNRSKPRNQQQEITNVRSFQDTIPDQHAICQFRAEINQNINSNFNNRPSKNSSCIVSSKAPILPQVYGRSNSIIPQLKQGQFRYLTSDRVQPPLPSFAECVKGQTLTKRPASPKKTPSKTKEPCRKRRKKSPVTGCPPAEKAKKKLKVCSPVAKVKKCPPSLQPNELSCPKIDVPTMKDHSSNPCPPKAAIPVRPCPKPCPPVEPKCGAVMGMLCKIINFFRARKNCPAPDEWKKKKLLERAEKAAKKAGMALCPISKCPKKQSKIESSCKCPPYPYPQERQF